MHRIQFNEILRDAEVAHAIHPTVLKHQLNYDEVLKCLLACGVARASGVARIALGNQTGVSPHS